MNQDEKLKTISGAADFYCSVIYFNLEDRFCREFNSSFSEGIAVNDHNREKSVKRLIIINQGAQANNTLRAYKKNVLSAEGASMVNERKSLSQIISLPNIASYV
ncbi:hypothetical protein AMECASPLE_015736 [Ameca splendens]|uniref:Uncharacterized protein n=1 Tax=Ameca splendens TaxID=208324 RepID=A0ABV0XF29_9TELE